GQFNLVGDANDPDWYWLEDATGQPVIGPDGNPLGRMSPDEVQQQIDNLVAARTASFTQSAPAADMPLPLVGREGTVTAVDSMGIPIDTRQRLVEDAPLQPGRATQQPAPVDSNGITQRLANARTGQ